MEFLLGVPGTAFVAVVITDTLQQRHRNLPKNR